MHVQPMQINVEMKIMLYVIIVTRDIISMYGDA